MDDLAAPIFANFERRWKVVQERLNRSAGQRARYARAALAETVARVRKELKLPNLSEERRQHP